MNVCTDAIARTIESMGSLESRIELTAAGRMARRLMFSRNPAPASGPITSRFTGVTGALEHSLRGDAVVA